MKERYSVFVLLLILIGVLFFMLTSNTVRKSKSKIEELDGKIKTAQEQLNSARIMDQQLSQFALIIDNSLTKTASFSFDEINDFKTKIGQLADQRSIQLNKLSDSNNSRCRPDRNHLQSRAGSQLREIGQFISDLEALDNILKIHALDISPTQVSDKEVRAPGAPNRYRMTLELSIFKVKKEV
jgi:Tfp pilus assembly protein PilO